MVSDPRNREIALVFELARQQYALSVMRVLEVVPLAALIRLPTAPMVLVGILRLRGALLAVVDLRARLGLPRAAPEIGHRIIITSVSTSSIGLLVDAVHGLRAISRPAKPVEQAISSRLICGVDETADGVVTLLDPDAIISHDLAAFLAATLNWREELSTENTLTTHVSRDSP